MVHQHLNGIEQGMLAANRRHGFFAAIVGLEISCVASHDSIAQLGGAAYSRVLREIILDCADRDIFDVLRRRKMWLARAQIHYIDALLPQFVGFGDYRHGGRGLDSVDAFAKSYRRGRFCNWSHARFPILDFLAFWSLMAGSSFSRNLSSTISGTRSWIDPPSFATSRTSRELR